jgi:hypothetical protein
VAETCRAQFEPVERRSRTHTCMKPNDHFGSHCCPVCWAYWTPPGVIDPHAANEGQEVDGG